MNHIGMVSAYICGDAPVGWTAGIQIQLRGDEVGAASTSHIALFVKGKLLLENLTPTANHWLQLEFVGTRSERDAIGAHVTAEFASTSIVQTVQTGDGYLSKNESALFIGLGPSKSVERLRVRCPSGAEQILEDLTGDGRWLLVEGDPNPSRL